MSPHTIHSYRDSLVLLLRFAASNRRGDVCNLDLEDLEPDQVLAFLAHLEKDRNNSITTRNVRLPASHAFFRYVGAPHPITWRGLSACSASPSKGRTSASS